MDPSKVPIQTPQRPGADTPYYSHYSAATPGPILQANDGSQFGAHHGTQFPPPPPSPWMTQAIYGMPTPGRFTTWSADKVAMMQSRLAKRLGPEYVTTRPGPGGGPKLSYIEGWKVVNLANEVFGFNGWSSSITQLKTDFLDVNAQDRCFVGITAIVRVTLQDGCYHEDIGYGHAENVRGKAAALEKAQKEAVTDALKRALKHFGNVLGNCLYDKEYTKEVGKMRVPVAKFNTDDLERRPEFTPQGAPARVSVPPAAAPPPPAPNFASAVPQHVSGHQKQAMPPPPPAPARSERGDTPLRSIEDVDINMDDSEFGYLEEESFLELEDSMLTAQAGRDVPMLTDKPAPAPMVSPPVNEPPRYQHRHRPDPPAAAPEPQPQAPADSRSSEPSPGKNDTVETRPAKRVVGGFANANGAPEQASEGATSAAQRRAAMMAAISAGTSVGPAERGPIRAQSPLIPSGGVDVVAVRAQSNIRVHGANLAIETTEQVEMTSIKHGMFASARGVKREGSQSPSKWDASRRTAMRAALTEIPVQQQTEPANDWKRSRMV